MSPQSTIAHYRIISKLGEGGMGEVWRAADTRLNREVAIKILPAAFASNPDRLARFTREARVLASLNHPNIAAIYGVEERALAMELVEGETLPCGLPFETALNYARQIAEALEYAHDKGIIHRDLKPANIKVTPEGRVKLLDFGLAKAIDATPPASANPADSPPPTLTETVAGVILGTAGYMAPEQARGHLVDRRADIWAFGVVLWEMVTGRTLFTGPTVSDTLAAVLKTEPVWERAPFAWRRLLRACLTKDPRKRLHSISDALRLVDEEPRQAATATAQRRPIPWIAAAAIFAALAVAGWWMLWRAARPANLPLTRLSVDLGPGATTGLNLTVAISPDGRRIVFPAQGPGGGRLLATRLLDQAQTTPLPGTEDGADPFFSPDGQWIGFWDGSQIKKIPVQGGAPVTLATVAGIQGGASWSEAAGIVAPMGVLLPLSRIPLAGGAPQTLTKLAPGQITHRWPQVLPGRNAVIFTASQSATSWDNASIEAVSLKTGQVKILQRGGSYGRYLPSGHLIYASQGALFGVKFDPGRLEVHGTPVRLLDDLASNPATGGGQFDFSPEPAGHGTFVYAAGRGAAQAWQVDWLDRSAGMQPLIATPGAYEVPRFSPDGRMLAYVGNGGDIYIYDEQRNTASRLTFTGNASVPVWAPDGRHIVFQSTEKSSVLYWIRSDGAGSPQRILEGRNIAVPWSFAPDGRLLAYCERSPETGFDIWTLPLDVTDPDHPKPGRPEPFLRTPADEILPRFSPDGRWIAYRSNESGNNEIFVRPFPTGNGGKWQISSGGGLYAFWSGNGHELFYETSENRIKVVDYTLEGGSFVPGKPRPWTDKQLFYAGASNMDLTPDGKRFAVFALPETTPGEKSPVHVTFLLNFFDEVKRRIP